ncbi:MAG TPA: transcription termination/antitermination protein NusG [Ktedonobacterales bacterium]|nr:transcription termination/antitermination protein NusG [Ktedonobacterales bacterium]
METTESGEQAQPTVEGAQAESQTVEAVTPVREEPQNPNRHWYAIHTYSGYENKVKTHLEARIVSMNMKDRIFRVVVPTEDEIEIKDGKRRTVTRKVYPGYVLVEMVLDAETWHAVRNTPGVTGFVGGAATEPAPLPDSELPYILRQPAKGEETPARPKVTYQVGQRVKVISEPFAEFIGVVSEVHPERNKLTVLVSFLGRETPVQLDYLQVEKM